MTESESVGRAEAEREMTTAAFEADRTATRHYQWHGRWEEERERQWEVVDVLPSPEQPMGAPGVVILEKIRSREVYHPISAEARSPDDEQPADNAVDPATASRETNVLPSSMRPGMGSTDRLTIRAYYIGTVYETLGPRLLDPPIESLFHVTADLYAREVSFGPRGNIMIRPEDLRGRGLGGYMLSDLIEFVRSRYPDFTVLGISRSSVDATDPRNRDRRDALYGDRGLLEVGQLCRDLRSPRNLERVLRRTLLDSTQSALRIERDLVDQINGVLRDVSREKIERRQHFELMAYGLLAAGVLAVVGWCRT